MPLKVKELLDEKQLKYLRNNEPETYAIFAKALTATPAKPNVTVERMTMAFGLSAIKRPAASSRHLSWCMGKPVSAKRRSARKPRTPCSCKPRPAKALKSMRSRG